MPATLAGTLLSRFDNWILEFEEAERRTEEKIGSSAIMAIATEGLFTEMALVIQCVKTNPESWKEINEFIRQQSGRYQSRAVVGCMRVMRTISELFISGA